MRKIAFIMAMILLLTGCTQSAAGNTTETTVSGADNTTETTEAAGDTTLLYTQPPELTIHGCGANVQVLRGTSTWNYDQGDGTWCSVSTDAPHPLQCKGSLEKAIAKRQTMELVFPVAPDSVTIRCWSDDTWKDTDAAAETVTKNGPYAELKVGAYIYEVIAAWDSADSFNGTAHYIFYIGYSEPMPL